MWYIMEISVYAAYFTSFNFFKQTTFLGIEMWKMTKFVCI